MHLGEDCPGTRGFFGHCPQLPMLHGVLSFSPQFIQSGGGAAPEFPPLLEFTS